MFLINRLPSKVLLNISPHEKLFLKPPDYAFLRVFGCLCYHLLRPYNKHKLDFCYTLCVFLGCCSNQHGYKCLDSSIRVYLSRCVRFHESVFLFVHSSGFFMQSSIVKNTIVSLLFFLPFKSSLCTPFDEVSLPSSSMSNLYFLTQHLVDFNIPNSPQHSSTLPTMPHQLDHTPTVPTRAPTHSTMPQQPDHTLTLHIMP